MRGLLKGGEDGVDGQQNLVVAKDRSRSTFEKRGLKYMIPRTRDIYSPKNKKISC